jgi:hypothetical protein
VAEYKLLLKSSAAKEIEAVDSNSDRRRIVEKIGVLRTDPRPLNLGVKAQYGPLAVATRCSYNTPCSRGTKPSGFRTERGDAIRIISISKATKHEARFYFSQITD